jgi:DNA-3-methyladenine glycosylase II
MVSDDMSIPFRLDEARIAEGLAFLARIDADFARAIAQHGPPPLRRIDEGFDSLLRAIVGQQVSVQAAASIWGKLVQTCGTVTPQRILELDDAALRGAGLSGAKMRYARGLALDALDGRIDFPGLVGLDDATVVTTLTQAKGIGRWTAEMYMMFALGRPDVLPVGDLGIVVAAQHLKRLRKRPEPKRLLKLSEPWSPWRTVAALFLWHYRRTMPDWSEAKPATPRAPGAASRKVAIKTAAKPADKPRAKPKRSVGASARGKPTAKRVAKRKVTR